MSLRARLTLWYTLVLAAMVSLFGSAVYVSLSYSMMAQIDDTLDRTADEIVRAYPASVKLALRALDITSNVYVQVWGVDGQLLLQSSNSPDSVGPYDPESLGLNENVYANREYGQTRLRVLTAPILRQLDGRIESYLQLGSSLETVDLVRQMLLTVLIGGGLIAVLCAAAVGYMTASTALRPIDQVTETALQITRADDLSRRIPMSVPPSSEDGRLILAINETLERLEDLFDAQRRFMADVSHELRTPLTAIRGNVDLIRHTGEADTESLDAITSEVDRMTRLVGDLLLLAKAESGELPLAKDVVELDTLMLEIYRQIKVLARDRVDVRIGQEDQARVIGDRDRLKQVALNLVANALDHTPSGGTITLSLQCVPDWACMSVSDTGSGISEEELPFIFQRFYRVDRSRKRKASGGVGLGLSIANWIVLKHGGRIEVSSLPGRGSDFSVWLPRVDENCGS